MPARRKVLISGYYGFGNAGDDAILGAMLQSMRGALPDLDLCVFSDNPAATRRDFGVRSVNRKNAAHMLLEMVGASLLVSGGGGLIQDSTGVNTIRYYLSVVRMARMVGTPVMFFAQGVGPVRTEAGRAITRKIANQVQLITVRDEASRDLFREMGVVRPPIIVTADPVMALQPASSERVEAIWAAEGLPRDVPVVAISVRPWPSVTGFEDAFVALGRHLVARHGVRVLVAPFQESQDRSVCARVAEGIGAGAQALSRTCSAPEIMGIVGRAHATIGMRLHALVFSAAQAVPVLGVAYDPKVEHFLRRMQAPCIPLEQLAADALIAEADRLLDGAGAHRERLARLAPGVREQALETVRLMGRLLNREPMAVDAA